MSNIIAAARFAEQSHRGVVRKYTGEPYINHPARVAGKVSYHPLAEDSLVEAAWLHDVVEDCEVPIEVIAVEFGDKVGKIVNELTNPSKAFPGWPRYKRKQIDLDHIRGISKEAKLIKIIDRMDNLRDYPTDNIDAWNFVRDKYFRESYNLYLALENTDKQLGLEFFRCLGETAFRFQIGV